MIEEYSELINRYEAWLHSRTSLREIGEWVEITTPFLDRHNDYLQIYAKKTEEGYYLTDDSYVIHDLQLSGCEIDSEKRLALFEQILNGFHVERNGDALFTVATSENFAVRKHSLLQSMLAVEDLFYLAQPHIKNLFFEDVARWFDDRDIRYLPNVKITGRSGFDYNLDFVVPKSRKMPERIVSTISNPDKNAAQKIITTWFDTKSARPENSVAYTFINDTVKEPTNSIVAALKKYDIKPVVWSRREDVVLDLSE